MKENPLSYHKRLRGKIEIHNKTEPLTEDDIKIIYTPGVVDVCKQIIADPNLIYDLTSKGNNIAIVTDGSRLLGLGDAGPEASLPVMEGKSALYKEYGNVDAYPICLKTKEKNEIINIITALEPSFGAINLEDIESPKVLDISKELEKRLSIPIFHDDRHGTAIITLAGLLNSLQILNKTLENVKVVVAGAGSAGYGITKLLTYANCNDITVLDSHGIVCDSRDDLNFYKQELAKLTHSKESGTLKDAIESADVFIGVSGREGLLSPDLIRTMNQDPIIFALTNPNPEIDSSVAKENGAAIVATGSYSYPNTVNNAVVFPNFIRAIFDLKIKKITPSVLYAAAKSIAASTGKPSKTNIVPQLNNRHIIKDLKTHLSPLA